MPHLASPTAHRRLLVSALVAVLIVMVGCSIKLPLPYPSLEKYRAYEQHRSESGPIRVRFLGVSSLLFQDSATSILSDGFVSRPGEGRVLLGRIRPNLRVIDSTIERLRIRSSLAAVFCVHSHYDHCLDAPVFAERTGAVLLGSQSTYNIGIGYGLKQGQPQLVQPGNIYEFREFHLTFIPSLHSLPDRVEGEITRPFKLPARKSAWKTGDTYSVHIRHGNRTLLVHSSANYEADALDLCPAEVVYLGIWGLGAQNDTFIDNYWKEVVVATGAKRVIPVHWDFFFRSLEDGLRPFPTSIASFEASMRHVLRRADTSGVEVIMPVLWLPTDPFAGLAEPPVADPGQLMCRLNPVLPRS